MTRTTTKETTQLPRGTQAKMRLFQRLLMSYVDFQQAAAISDYILKENLHDRLPETGFALEGLSCGMIVAYCRPFSGNDRRAKRRIPDLPASILRVLTDDERRLQEIVLKDRNAVLAHSDSDAWEPGLEIFRVPGKDILLPIFNPIHSPLTREATARFQIMARKLMEACFEQRMRLEPELTPHLPVVEYTEEELHRIAEKAGFKLPPDIGEAS